jgi:hypothetical protein
MLVKREIHWIFSVFDRTRMKALSGQAEEREKTGAAAERRGYGFGAASPEAAPSGAAASGAALGGGFGRRKAPIPESTDGLPPRAVANDRGPRLHAPDGEIEPAMTFSLRGAHDSGGAHHDNQHALPVASDDLAHALLTWLQGELRRGRNPQHETVLCALGALAGYAAQQAIRETLVKPGKLTLDQAFVVIETRSGEVFFFGDLLNEIIVDKHGLRGESSASIWKVVAEGGHEAGAINLPDVTDMIKYCAATAGHEEFGIPRVPDAHMPELLPREALSRFWPAARRKLAGREPMSWPLHLAMAARMLIVDLKGAIRPDIAVGIVMEAAVSMSKIDPVTLPKE